MVLRMKGDWVFCRGDVVPSILQTLTERTGHPWGDKSGSGGLLQVKCQFTCLQNLSQWLFVKVRIRMLSAASSVEKAALNYE